MSNRRIRVRQSLLSDLIAASILRSMHRVPISQVTVFPVPIFQSEIRSQMQSPAPPQFIEAKCEGKIDDCSICLSEIKTSEDIIILPCCHTFHNNCIMQWLARNNTCPICRKAC